MAGASFVEVPTEVEAQQAGTTNMQSITSPALRAQAPTSDNFTEASQATFGVTNPKAGLYLSR